MSVNRSLASIFLFALCLMASDAAAERTLRLASWNVGNLWHVEGEALRPRPDGTPAYGRTKADFERLRKYVKRLNGDVVALQEMGSPDAARLLFPKAEWHLVFSGRLKERLASDPDALKDPKKRRIYTAVAIRKVPDIKILETRYVPQFSVLHIDPRNDFRTTTRGGVAVKLDVAGRQFWFLSVHLKSSCQHGSLDSPEQRFACVTLAKQAPVLEWWIGEHFMANERFVVAGDFNRRLGQHNDHLWKDLTDPVRLPVKGSGKARVELRRYPSGTSPSACPVRPNKDRPKRDLPIDFLVVDRKLLAAAPAVSSGTVLYDEVPFDWKGNRDTIGDWDDKISDHCPVYLDLRFADKKP